MTSSEIGGWIWPSNVRTALTYLSLWIGYDFTETDWQAIEIALPDTDSEAPHGWYEYPLIGTPELTVTLAGTPGDQPINIRVQGKIDQILAARVETLISILADVHGIDG